MSRTRSFLVRLAAVALLAATASCALPRPKDFGPKANIKEVIPPEIHEMCKKDGGLNVYRTVKGVRGLYLAGKVENERSDNWAELGALRRRQPRGCPSCAFWLAVVGYDFVEAPFSIPIGYDGEPVELSEKDFLMAMASEPGLYRYTLQRKGHPDCALYRERQRRVPSNTGRIPGLRGVTHCIASNRIDNISARYEIEQRNEIAFSNDVTRVIRFSRLIRDRRRAEILAEGVQYMVRPRDYRRFPDLQFRCPTTMEGPIAEEILVPNWPNQND